MVVHLFDEVVGLPQAEDEWASECKGSIENCEFRCVGAWDGFHVHVACGLKNYYRFKNKCTVTSTGLGGYSKRFLHLATGAPGSVHDARLLRYSTLFKKIVAGVNHFRRC